MSQGSEYRVKIIIDSKDQSTPAVRSAIGSWTELKSALGLAKAAFLQVYQAAAKAAEFVAFGGRVQRAEVALNNLAASAGQSGDAIVKAMQEASNFTIDRMTAMSAANKAMLLNVAQTPEEFARLARYATLLGRAMGQDAATSIDNFVVAAGRQSRLIADNLGLMVDAETAYKKYAAANGIAADSMTDVQKKAAFLQEMLSQAEEKVGRLGESSAGAAGSLEVLKAAVGDTKAELALMAAEAFEGSVNTDKLAASIREIPDALREAQRAQIKYSQSLGEAEAYLSGDTIAVQRYRAAITGLTEEGLWKAQEATERYNEAQFEAIQANRELHTSADTVQTSYERYAEIFDVTAGTIEKARETTEKYTAAQDAMRIATEKAGVAQMDLAQHLADASQAEIAQAAIKQLKVLLDEGKISYDTYRVAVMDTQLAYGLTTKESNALAGSMAGLAGDLAAGRIRADEYAAALSYLTGRTMEGVNATEAYRQALGLLPRDITITITEKRVTLEGGRAPVLERQSGGPAGGLTLVGERGPEMVVLPRGSYVHDAAETRQMTNHYTFNQTVNTAASAHNVMSDFRLAQSLAR